jgi:nucleotide-binding universal stress UspA family protein
MKRDTNLPPQPASRGGWGVLPPSAGLTHPATVGGPSSYPLWHGRCRPAHLVFTNGPARRDEVLLGVAGRLAGMAGAAVRVACLYVSPPPGELEVVRRLSPAGTASAVEDICDRLFRAARTLAGRTGLPVTPELLIGPTDPTLTEYVRVQEFDLATAASGATWLSLWGGGPWYAVARQRPVLVVGPGVSESWPARPRPTGEVVVALDGTASAEEVLAPAASLCRLLDARLTLLRVIPPGGAGDSVDQCREYLLDLGRLFRRHVPAVRTVVASGRAADAVLAVQRATGAVVALAAPARSRLSALTPGRLAVRVLRGSTAPVLFYRPTR